MDNLPNEVIIQHLIKLEFKELFKMCSANKRINSICKRHKRFIYRNILERSLGEPLTNDYIAWKIAIEKDSLEIVKILSKALDINATGTDQNYTIMTVLIKAIKNMESPDIVNYILDQNPDVNQLGVSEEGISISPMMELLNSMEKNRNMSRRERDSEPYKKMMRIRIDILNRLLLMGAKADNEELNIIHMLNLTPFRIGLKYNWDLNDINKLIERMNIPNVSEDGFDYLYDLGVLYLSQNPLSLGARSWEDVDRLLSYGLAKEIKDYAYRNFHPEEAAQIAKSLEKTYKKNFQKQNQKKRKK